MHFLIWKCKNFVKDFNETNYQYFRIGSDDGLAPSRWQAIIWTNDNPVYWDIYASLSLCELKMHLEYVSEDILDRSALAKVNGYMLYGNYR